MPRSITGFLCRVLEDDEEVEVEVEVEVGEAEDEELQMISNEDNRSH